MAGSAASRNRLQLIRSTLLWSNGGCRNGRATRKKWSPCSPTNGQRGIAELTLEYRPRKAALATLDLDKIAAEAAELQRIQTTIEELRSNRPRRKSRRVETGRLMGEVWAEASIAERRDLIQRALRPSGFLTIRPGRSGGKGFQLDRVRDREKLEEIPPANYPDPDPWYDTDDPFADPDVLDEVLAGMADSHN
jgi:hypothetical protein